MLRLGVFAWPFSLLPQQVTVSMVVSAQVWKAPAEMLVWVPDGGLVCPMVLSPQHSMLPWVSRAQVCCQPAVMAV